MAAAKDWSKTREYRELKKDMLEDLDARGLVSQQYRDKVQEYMDLWCYRKMLNADIMDRGVSVSYSNGATQRGVTDNKSLTGVTRVCAQMLQIWTALGFRDMATSNRPLPQGGDDDEL